MSNTTNVKHNSFDYLPATFQIFKTSSSAKPGSAQQLVNCLNGNKKSCLCSTSLPVNNNSCLLLSPGKRLFFHFALFTESQNECRVKRRGLDL